jgi:hypothetical protein
VVAAGRCRSLTAQLPNLLFGAKESIKTLQRLIQSCLDMFLSNGSSVYLSQGGYSSAVISHHQPSIVYSAAAHPAVYTGYGSYHNAVVSTNVALQNPHDPFARAVAAKEYRRMKKISGSTITGKSLALPPKALGMHIPAIAHPSFGQSFVSVR